MRKPIRHVRTDRQPETATARGTPLAWYRYYPGDHLRVLRGWPLVARAVYRELLDVQWDMELLPAAPQRLREIVGATAEQWRVAWAYCARLFPRDGAGRRNPELERVRAMQLDLVARCRQAGRQGNRVRWGKPAAVISLRPGADDA